jgi:hypothetical protein
MNIDRIYNIPGAVGIKREVERMAKELIKFDEVDKVDLSRKEGEVLISLREMRKAGCREAIKLSDGSPCTDKIQFARINYDVNTREVKAADIKTIRVYDSLLGEGVGDKKHFQFEEKKADGRNVQIFYEYHRDSQSGEARNKVATMDKLTGQVVRYELLS